MSDLAAYEARRRLRISTATVTVKAIFEKYGITSPAQVKQQLDRFTQADLDDYQDARQTLYDEGALG